jgi:hypothetical protein
MTGDAIVSIVGTLQARVQTGQTLRLRVINGRLKVKRWTCSSALSAVEDAGETGCAGGGRGTGETGCAALDTPAVTEGVVIVELWWALLGVYANGLPNQQDRELPRGIAGGAGVGG